MIIIDKTKYNESQLEHWCKLGFISKVGLNYIIPNKDVIELSRAIDNSVCAETTYKLMFFI